MSSIGTGYDQSTTTYSPDGRVFQIEYAAKAVENSGTAVGIRCKDGVVMGVEKPKLSKMLVEGSNRRVFTIDKQSGMCVSGLQADGRQIVNYTREESINYLDFYGSPIPGNILCDRVASLMHFYTLSWCAPRHPPPSRASSHRAPPPRSRPSRAPLPVDRQVRPFGAQALLCNYGEDGPQLYHVRPAASHPPRCHPPVGLDPRPIRRVPSCPPAPAD